MKYVFDLPRIIVACYMGALAATFLSPAPAPAAPTTVLDNGPSSNRVDIVFLGDGYTQANHDAGLFDQHIQNCLNHLFSGGPNVDVFPRYQKFFNVHKITTVSNESGADIPSQGVFKDTAMDATYDSNGVDRSLTISGSKAALIARDELTGTGINAEIQIASVNHTLYGGTGGSWAVYAGGNAVAPSIAVHELGHSFGLLGDEYIEFPGQYPFPEPSAPNLTKNSTGAKWEHWLGFEDPRSPFLNIGVFEGGGQYEQGIYRPSLDSKMSSLTELFNAVSRESIILEIYKRVDPLDRWLNNLSDIVDSKLWVDVIDPEVIQLQWYIDNVLVEGATGEVFEPWKFGYGPGAYNVAVRAYDGAADHAFNGSFLDLVRKDLGKLEQRVDWSWSLTHSIPEPSQFALILSAMLTIALYRQNKQLFA